MYYQHWFPPWQIICRIRKVSSGVRYKRRILWLVNSSAFTIPQGKWPKPCILFIVDTLNSASQCIIELVVVLSTTTDYTMDWPEQFISWSNICFLNINNTCASSTFFLSSCCWNAFMGRIKYILYLVRHCCFLLRRTMFNSLGYYFTTTT